MKKYKAIFFDWDGTAVRSRSAPVEEVVKPMQELLHKGIKLVVVSGTTFQNIAAGKLYEYFSSEERKNLYMGLGRGAFNYYYKDGKVQIFSHKIPEKEVLLGIHKTCFDVHCELYEKYDLPTDIVFSRPNYCKIDLMVEQDRGEQLFLQENEVEILKSGLESHGFTRGLSGLIDLAVEKGKTYQLPVSVTTDAKYLEVGISSKSDNVNTILSYLGDGYGILPEECAYFGDEYIGLEDGIYGSDSFMITQLSGVGDFFDVSEMKGIRPVEVQIRGGGVEGFIGFLKEQLHLSCN